MLATTQLQFSSPSSPSSQTCCPPEILTHIFRFCSNSDIAKCAQVSKTWFENATSLIWQTVTLSFGDKEQNTRSRKVMEILLTNSYYTKKVRSLHLLIYPEKHLAAIENDQNLELATDDLWCSLKIVQAAIQNVKELVELNISVEDEFFDDEPSIFHNILDSLYFSLPKLRKYTLSAPLEYSLATLFDKVYTCWPNLVDISLSGLTLEQSDEPPQSAHIPLLEQLTSLELINVSLSPSWFSFITSRTRKLRRLVLEYCDRFDCTAGLDRLRFKSQWCSNSNSSEVSNLEELYLCGVYSRYGLEECICNLLNASPYLKTLTLQDISGLSTITLMTIANHIHLEDCIVSICHFIEEKPVPRTFFPRQRQLKRLKLFGLSLTDIQFGILVQNATILQTIDLGRLPLLKGVDLAMGSSSTILSFPNLHSLILQQMRCFQNAGLTQLTQHSSQSLRRLIIINCPYLKDEGVCSVLKKSPDLKEVAFGKCVWISDMALRCLAEYCPKARFLSWVYNVQ